MVASLNEYIFYDIQFKDPETKDFTLTSQCCSSMCGMLVSRSVYLATLFVVMKLQIFDSRFRCFPGLAVRFTSPSTREFPESRRRIGGSGP